MTFFFGSPEELQERMDKMEMANDEFQHALENIWQNLSNDDLMVIAKYIMSLAHNEMVHVHLAMLGGRLYQMHAERTHTCLLDGKDHDAELNEMATAEPKPEPLNEQEARRAETSKTALSVKAIERAENMRIWRLEDYDENGVHKVRCKDCKMEYASLSDRMVKGPDECPGCFHKAKFG